ncbi:MAG: LIC12192 family sporadic carbohydrate cluster protein [Vulcanimicrobiaceae bacterium]
MATRSGYRGYMSTRAVRGTITPQRVQNLVIRDYASRNGLPYLVSVSEFAMPGCYMMFENALLELDHTLGIIAFSAFMLPRDAEQRSTIYERIFGAGATLHAALENLCVSSPGDIPRFEDLLSAAFLLDRVPFSGRYEKSDRPLSDSADPFARLMLTQQVPE